MTETLLMRHSDFPDIISATVHCCTCKALQPYHHISPQGLGNAVGGLHEAGHGIAGAVMDELLHPLYGHLIILPKPQLLLHSPPTLLCPKCQSAHGTVPYSYIHPNQQTTCIG